MARNKVQFQKGLSLSTFIETYGTEDQCFDALYEWRWLKGFQCPQCGYDKSCRLTTRKLQQCHHQTSLTAGTVFDNTKLPLTKWFQGIYLISQDKKVYVELTMQFKKSMRNVTWQNSNTALIADLI